MNKATFVLTALAFSLGVAGLSACSPTSNGGGNAAQGNAVEPPLAGARIGANFTLIDQNGKTVHWTDFAGKYRLVYFGYTYCPDVCPVDLQKIMAGFHAFEKQAPARAARVQPIFITVDPERDTPAILKPWVAAFHPRLLGLTGTEDQIAKVAQDFAVVYSKDGSSGNGKTYLMSHSRTPYLFGPKGEPIALVPVDEPDSEVDEGAPEEVRRFLDQWVK